jgi:hypothetical protein
MTDIPFLGDHIALSGRWLLAITRQLTLMDVGQPCRPLERFSEPWPIYPVSFAVEGGTVAMADGSSGLIVGRLAPPGDGVDGTPAPDVPCPPTLTPVPTFAPPTPTATRTPFPSATRPVPTSPIRLTATQVLPRRTRSTPVRSVLWLPIGHR